MNHNLRRIEDAQQKLSELTTSDVARLLWVLEAAKNYNIRASEAHFAGLLLTKLESNP